jgi:hypothetical protein
MTYIIFQIILFTYDAVFCVRRSCSVGECLCQVCTMLPYTRAVVMLPCNSRWSKTDRRSRAPVCVAMYLVVMTHSLSLEIGTGKLLCCVWRQNPQFKYKWSGRPAGPTTNTARLSQRYESKTRSCHCCHWAPDDAREDARNMLSCK